MTNAQNTDTQNTDARIQKLDELAETMRQADQYHTLEEQTADMKRRGINATEQYAEWDDEDTAEDDWGDATWKENGKWESKTPADLDDDNVTPPPIV
ncbi:hypothetical protein [Moraxella lincolnii]|uniref:hypothetical protein n=1 Tax=Lwoffella lincolnii TaxID=90241 RepID=UPI0030D032E4